MRPFAVRHFFLLFEFFCTCVGKEEARCTYDDNDDEKDEEEENDDEGDAI